MASIRDPVCELQATALFRGNRGLRSPHRHAHETARRRVAERIRIATNGHPHVGWGFRILHGDGLRFAGMKILAVREAQFHGLELRFQVLVLLFAGGIRRFTQHFQLRLQRGFFLAPSGQCLLMLRSCDSIYLQHGQRHPMHIAPDAVACFERRLRTAEHASERVVVLLADGVELVIVAAHAAQRHAEEGGAHLAHLAVHEVMLHLQLVDGVDVHITQHDETGRNEILTALLRRGGRQQITRELLANEAIVGFVMVKGIHEVVAIPPRVFRKNFTFCADLLGITHEVQPVPRPTLAVSVRIQQAIHHALVRLWRVVRDKGGDLLLRRR